MNHNHKEVELINVMLASLPAKHQSVKDQMTYERGYLTGILATLAHDDSHIRVLLQQRLKDLTNKHRN